MKMGRRTSSCFLRASFSFVLLLVCLWLSVSAAGAQVEPTEEVAANLAEGRVIICVAKDGIVLATVASKSERGSVPPVVVPISALRAGVLLGAVDWTHPASGEASVRLDGELRNLASAALNNSSQTNNLVAASDLEAIGVSVLERIRALAGEFHGKIDLGENEPLIRLVLASYVPDYGPDVWTLDYSIRQDPLGNGYYQTRVLRPSYTQLYPPEKGQPHTFIEVQYPPASRVKQAPELLDLLRGNDPRLAAIRASDEKVEKSLDRVVEGESQKSDAAPDAEFLRAAIPAVAGQDAKMSMVNIDFQNGYQWLVEPPAAQRPPEAPREPGAPTLRRKPTS
jgi:hypothetical protein